MDHRFKNLRSTIYATEVEFKRFRQLVVNSVMATDVVDKELKALRNARWDKAFPKTSRRSSRHILGDDRATTHAASAIPTVPPPVHDDPDPQERQENVNRKATIVIEHLIQASDVAHTMQHWHVYRKWNERFFLECYQAFQAGRAHQNPAEYWYKGELGFFDFSIIPLAKKLKDCGVFGVSSDEYLNYAMRNREQWECFGEELVAMMVERLTKSR